MKLFDLEFDPAHNLLPHDGTVYYYGKVLNDSEAQGYYKALLDHIQWKNDEAIIFGKKIITKRKVAWYGDKPYTYTYSKTTKSALPWTRELLKLKALTDQHLLLTDSDLTFKANNPPRGLDSSLPSHSSQLGRTCVFP